MIKRKLWSFNVHLHDIGIEDNNLYPTEKNLQDALNKAECAFKTINDLGGSYVRTDFSWKLVQPDDNGLFKADILDFFKSYVELAKSYDIEVICNLYQTPKWAMPGMLCDPQVFYERFKAYCNAIAKAMEGKVRYYQFWNESNNILTFFRDDYFATLYDFPKMFKMAEDGLRDAGYDYEVILNFLINFVTELDAVSSLVNNVVGPVVDTLVSIRDFDILNKLGPLLAPIARVFISDDLIRNINLTINQLKALRHLYTICFSWKSAINYYLQENNNQNPDNKINIYGIDHYPGTWTNREYDDWSVLNDTASIVNAYDGKSAAILETGFATWGGDAVLIPAPEHVEETASSITLGIAQLFIDTYRTILNPILGLIPDIIRNFIDSAIHTDDAIRGMFTTIVNPVIAAALKPISSGIHSYDEQEAWIKKSFKGLHENNLWKSQRFINWYELKDRDSTRTLNPENLKDFFDIAEDNFGIMLSFGSQKVAYPALKENISQFLTEEAPPLCPLKAPTPDGMIFARELPFGVWEKGYRVRYRVIFSNKYGDSVVGPWSDNMADPRDYYCCPFIIVPTDPTGLATGRKIERKLIKRDGTTIKTIVGEIPDNITQKFIDTSC